MKALGIISFSIYPLFNYSTMSLSLSGTSTLKDSPSVYLYHTDGANREINVKNVKIHGCRALLINTSNTKSEEYRFGYLTKVEGVSQSETMPCGGCKICSIIDNNPWTDSSIVNNTYCCNNTTTHCLTKNIIYLIKCTSCEYMYVGEASRQPLNK